MLALLQAAHLGAAVNPEVNPEILAAAASALQQQQPATPESADSPAKRFGEKVWSIKQSNGISDELYTKIAKIVSDAVDFEYKVRHMSTPSPASMLEEHVKVVKDAIDDELKANGWTKAESAGQPSMTASSAGASLVAQYDSSTLSMLKGLKKIIENAFEYEFKFRNMDTPQLSELRQEHKKVVRDTLAFELKFYGYVPP